MRILFITYTRIGDAILSTGVLSHLLETHPGARVTVAAGPAAAPLFEAVEGLERLIVMDKLSGRRHWLQLWRQCAGHRWDVVVDLRASLLAYLLFAGERHVLRRRANGDHRVRQIARVLRLDPPPPPRIWTKAEHWEAAEKIIPDGTPALAVGPTANWRGKMWRSARFAELIDRLTGADGPLRGARVAVFGAAAETDLAKPVLASVQPVSRLDLVGKVDLLTAFTCLRRCALYIGNDSGLMHLAAATGIPTLGLFGPSRVEHYAPWGPLAAAVCTPVPYEELVGGKDYDHRTTGSLMDSLAVDDVEAAVLDLLARASEAAA